MQFYPIVTHRQPNANHQWLRTRKQVALSWLLGGTLLLTLLFFSSFRFPVQGAGQDEPEQIDFTGVVVSAPAHPNGYGAWKIQTEKQRRYTLKATAATEFKKGIPHVAQSVKVKGVWDGSQQIRAQEIELLTEDEDDTKVKGLLVRAPDNSSGIGVWIIQNRANFTRTLIATNATRLDNGIPPLGSWIEARGQWQANGTLLATRIRADEHVVNQVIVRLADGVISSTVASQYGLLPLGTLLASGNIHLLQTGEDREADIIKKLRADTSQVLWAELNYAGGIPEGHGYKTWHWGGDDPSGYINQNAFAQINLTEQGSVQGAGVIIAVLDTGVDLAHPALQDRLLPGRDMVDDDALANDEGDGLGWGHGTHIAGILAKVAPQSQILPVRVLDTDGRGNIFTLAYAIEWAVAEGADVINLSLGAEGESLVLKDTIQKALNQGVIVVAAAGNENTNVPQFPATYPGVIAVTAVDDGNYKADFANYSAAWVDLAAPGVGITSTMVGPQGSGYASWSGTSMSTPFVSGAAALLRQVLPAASPADLAARLSQHSANLDTLNPAYAGQLGGLLDVGATLADALAVTPTPTPTGTMHKVYLPVTQR